MRIERFAPAPVRAAPSSTLRCDYGKRLCTLCLRKKRTRGGRMRNHGKWFHCAECVSKSAQP